MPLHNSIKLQPFYIKLAAVLIILIAIGYLVILGKDLLSPILFSCLLSILLLPVTKWLEAKIRVSKGVAAMLSVVLLLVVVGLVLYIIGSQLTDLRDDWPQFKQQLGNLVNTFQQWLTEKYHINQNKQLTYIEEATGKLLNSSTLFVGATLLSLSSLLLFLVFTFIYTFLFLVYRSLIMRFLLSVFKKENKAAVYDIIAKVQYIIRKYIVGLLLEMLIVGSVVGIAFSIMGIKYAALLGIVTGVFNLIPYIGIFSALVLSTLITFATAAAASKVILVVLTLVVVHLIDSNILLPIIVGSKVRINAIVTLIGVILGEMIWGISGMFLSIPVIAVMKIVFDRVESLKPWGILLGDDEKNKPKPLVEDVQTKLSR